MESSKLVVKFYATELSDVKSDEVVPVFHAWIQSHALADHMLIDVADYSHVHDGPGTVLIAHEANVYFDRFDGRSGLSYWRKRPLYGSLADRLRTTFRAALECAALLETDSTLGEKIRFKTNQATFQINDRLLAPNTDETFALVAPQLQEFASQLWDADVSLQRESNPKKLFGVLLDSSKSPDIATLLTRSGSTPERSTAARDRQAAASSLQPAPAATSFARFDAGL